MKFPLRLSLDLFRHKIARAFSGGSSDAIFHLSSADIRSVEGELHEAEPRSGCAPSRAEAAAFAAPPTQAPVVWVGGDEPLRHPAVGRLAAALNALGRNLFLHTNGVELRQRIHEFRPEERLFLTVEFAGREKIHDEGIGRPGSFRRAMEGIRSAKLSGFHVCAHVTVDSQTDPCEIGELFEFLDRYDVDGFIASSRGLARRAAANGVQGKLEEIRSLVRCSRWENFSRLLEASYKIAQPEKSAVSVPRPETSAFEESA